MVPLEKGLQWVNVKQKPFREIQAHSGIIGHIQKLFRDIQAYSEPCVTLACLETWYNQNTNIFRTRSIFRTLAYSQPWYIQNSDIFRTIATYNSFGLGSTPPKSHEQGYLNFQQKPWKKRVNDSFLVPATLQIMNFFLGIFQGFCLKASEDFFHGTHPCIFVVIVNRLCTVFLR